MKKHRFEVLLRELAASEEMPGWQDELHRMVQAELAAVAGERDETAIKRDLILAECPLQNHDRPEEHEEQADADPEQAS